MTLGLPTGNEWFAVVLAYLIGAIPFGFIFAKLKGVDIRSVGSGNIGATNTSRALGKPLGLLAFGLDFVKGYAPAAFLAPVFSSGEAGLTSLMVLCGLAAVMGHCWPVYLGFRGGKGVASGCGAVIAVDPVVFAIGGVVFIMAAFAIGYISLSSMAMVITFIGAAWYRNGEGGGSELELVWGCAVLAVMVWWRHRSNLKRLLSGLEPRLGGRK